MKAQQSTAHSIVVSTETHVPGGEAKENIAALHDKSKPNQALNIQN